MKICSTLSNGTTDNPQKESSEIKSESIVKADMSWSENLEK